MTHRGRNEGSIFKRANGRWVAMMSLGDGTRKSFSGKTRQEVQRRLTEALRDRDKGLPIIRDERESLAHYLPSWLAIIKPTVRPSTWQRYEELCRLHVLPGLGTTPLTRLSVQHLNALYAAKLADGLTPRTVRYIHATLHKALHDAQAMTLVQRNVAELATAPRPRPAEMQTFTPEQARRFLEEAHEDRFEALYLLAITSGMRLGELLALRWSDVDLEQGYLIVQRTLRYSKGSWNFAEPKTAHGRRKLILTSLACEALRRHRACQAAERLALGPIWTNTELIFTDEVGQPLRGITVYRDRFMPLCRRADVPTIRFHDLRHTAATLLLLQGVNAKVVSEMLGHASVTITLSLYAHVLPDMQKDAAAAFDRLLLQA
jgi:integrase